MNKHAYMIMAHNNFELLEMKLRLLDSEKNDFYIHVDSNVNDIDFEYLKMLPRYSKVYFTDRVHVTWGGFSMIEAELLAGRLKYVYKNKNVICHSFATFNHGSVKIPSYTVINSTMLPRKK